MAEARDPTAAGGTRFAGLIGDPVAHSASPALHHAAAAAVGIDLRYGAFLVRAGDVPAAIEGARALGFVGLSVTMPHKEAAARACWQRSPEVEALGVANTVVFRAGVATAYNTDGAGFVEDLEVNCGISLSGTPVAIFGTGGAARAVSHACGRSGARVYVVGRDPTRAAAVAALGGGEVADETALSRSRLVVNATPLGMAGAPTGPEAAAIEALGAHLGRGQLFVDLVTAAPVTPTMAVAASRGAATRNGIGMLVHQALRQFELFTGTDAPVEAMWAAVADRV